MTVQPSVDKGLFVLVVDDNPDDLARFQRAVRDQGWRVDTAESGRQALEKARAAPYDLIVLDYNLGDMTGTEVLLRLKEGGNPSPVLIQSGLGSHFIVARALALGAEGFVAKDSATYEAEILSKVGAAVSRARVGTAAAGRAPRREFVQEVETVLDDLMERSDARFDAVGFSSPDGFRISTRFRRAGKLTAETICAMVASAASTCTFLGEGFAHPGLRLVSAEFSGGRFWAVPVLGYGVLFVSTADSSETAAARAELEFAAKELGTLLSTMSRAEQYTY